MEGISLPVMYLTFSKAPGCDANGPEPVTDLVIKELRLKISLVISLGLTCSSCEEPGRDGLRHQAVAKLLQVSHFSILKKGF